MINFSAATALSLFIIIGTFIVSTRQSQADTCFSGTIAITSATRADATAAGIPASAQCWNPGDPNVGIAPATAKTWLEQHATKSSNIICENPQFAEKLMKFMQAVPSGTPTITSGYRDPSVQVHLVAIHASHAGPCQSYHNYGLAADFNNNTKQQTAWMRANASSYGLKTIGTWDPNHFEDNGGMHGQCGSCNSVGGDGTTSSGSPTLNSGTPDDVAPYNPTTPGQCAQLYVYMGNQCVMTPQSNPVSGMPMQAYTATTPNTSSVAATPSSYQPQPATTQLFQTSTAATPSTYQPQPATIQLFQTSTSASQAINIMTNLGTAAASNTVLLNLGLNGIVQNIIPGTTTTAPQAVSNITQQITYPQDTFSTTSVPYVPGSASEIDQILQPFKNVLTGLLAFLQNL